MASRKIHRQVDVSEVIDNTVLHVTITGVWKFKARLWIAKWFFAIGAWIIGSEIEVETNG